MTICPTLLGHLGQINFNRQKPIKIANNEPWGGLQSFLATSWRQKASRKLRVIRTTRLLEVFGPDKVPKGRIRGAILNPKSVKIYAKINADFEAEKVINVDENPMETWLDLFVFFIKKISFSKSA